MTSHKVYPFANWRSFECLVRSVLPGQLTAGFTRGVIDGFKNLLIQFFGSRTVKEISHRTEGVRQHLDSNPNRTMSFVRKFSLYNKTVDLDTNTYINVCIHVHVHVL